MINLAAEKQSPKAIALLSGGLDSALAAAIVKAQGVEVIGLHLYSPFGCHHEVQETANELGIRLLVRDKGEAYLDLLENPKFGYGKNMNPCIDCRIYMFQIATKVLEEEGAHFIVTGEVLGQRPMSQQKHSIALIDRHGDSQRKVFRPLSAQHFPKTEAEEKGWISSEAVMNISGRGRKDQIALAKELGVTRFTSPGGGCLLTESRFSERLRDFFKHDSHLSPADKLARAEVLRYGRHFRISEKLKAIVARNNVENNALEKLWAKTQGVYFEPSNFQGPVAIAYGDVQAEGATTIAQIISRYGKSFQATEPAVKYSKEGVQEEIHITQPITEDEITRFLI